MMKLQTLKRISSKVTPVQLTFKLTLLASALLLAACSNNDSAKNYYLAPEPIASGSSVGDVDIASGKLSRSESDLSSSTLSFSRLFVSQGAGNAVLGGWQHNFGSQLDGKGIPYASWKGLKTRKFIDAEKACTDGWGSIKANAYNGKLVNAQPIFHEGLCDLYLDSEIVASLPVRYSGGNNPYPLHSLTRPDGTTYTFFKNNEGDWKTTTRTPLTLKKSGNNWQITTLSDAIETYNASGRLINMTNASGQTSTLSYQDGKLSKITGHFGKTLVFTYKNGRLDSAKGVDGTSRYAYDKDGRLTSVTKVDGTKNSYQYTNGKLTSIVDATGNTVATYTYDATGRVTKTEGANGSNAKTINYSSTNVSVGDPNTSATDTYQFLVSHGVMKIASITDTDGGKQTYEYDGNGYPSKVTAKNGTVTTTTYNKRGLLVSRTESAGTASARTTLTEWHQNLRKPTKQVEPGKVTFSEYNTKGLLEKRIQGTVTPASKRQLAKGLSGLQTLSKSALKKETIREQLFEYNANGQSSGTTAANGAKTETSYDDKGNRSGSKNALGHENKTLEFDAAGRALKTQDANGIISTSVYDSTGRLTSTTRSGQTTTYEYDSVGRQTRVSYPDGSTNQSEYDSTGNLVKTIDQDGNTTENSFDANGNQTANKIMDASGAVLLSSQSVYNNKNQLVKSIDADGNQTSYEYDGSGNQVKTTDANGNETKNEYDGENRLVKTIDALGGETSYEYDTNGNRTKVVAPNGATTTFEYDNFNQLIKEISPDRGTTTYQYDVSGNQIQITDANGNIKNISYDILNRKTGESWEGHPDLTITYEYDSCRIGALCKTTDKSGSTTLSYDSEGKITQKDSDIEGTTLTLKYSYTDDDKLQSVTYPSGKVISYSYDIDKVKGINVDGNPLISEINYNAASQLTGWKWSDGSIYSKTYDANGRLKTFPLGNEIISLAYDSVGNIVSWKNSNSDEYHKFSYNSVNKLTSFYTYKNDLVDPVTTNLFEYDLNGNRLKLLFEDAEIPDVISKIIENSNKVKNINLSEYSYDPKGNITSDGKNTYNYDLISRLVGVNGDASYLYNASNKRVKKTTLESTTLYGWNDERIFSEYDQTGQVIQETVYFESTPIAVIDSNKIYKVFSDQVGSPRVITNLNNITVWDWKVRDAFGNSVVRDDVDNDGIVFKYNLRFPGHYYDAESGNFYNYNRVYNPETGRYLQADPIGLSGGMNIYEYANSNTLRYIDEDGKNPLLAAGGAIIRLLPFIAARICLKDRKLCKELYKCAINPSNSICKQRFCKIMRSKTLYHPFCDTPTCGFRTGPTAVPLLRQSAYICWKLRSFVRYACFNGKGDPEHIREEDTARRKYQSCGGR